MPGGRPKRDAPKRRRRGSGSVGTRANGRIFCVLPADLDPHRRPIYTVNRRPFFNEDEAAAFLSAEIVRLSAPVEANDADELLAEYLQRWWTAGSVLWPARTASAYKRALSRIAPLLGPITLGELTHVRIREAISRLLTSSWQRRKQDGTITKEATYSRRSVEQTLMVLGLAVQDLVPDVLPQNPVRRVKLPKAQLPEQPVWDADEAERFLVAAEEVAPHLALAFRLILKRALRHGEVLALRWSDLIEAKGVLVIDETIGQRAGQTGDTKGRRRREIPLSADLIARLKEHKQQQQRPSIWVFANPETGLPWVHNSLDRWTPKIARHAGVPPIRPKDMRATAATNLLLGGVPLPVVSNLLGHSSIAITAQFYARVLRHKEEAISRLSENLDAALDSAAEVARGEAPKPIRRAD